MPASTRSFLHLFAAVSIVLIVGSSSRASASTFEDMLLYRVQVQTKTCTLNNSNSSGATYLKLNDSETFWLDNPGDDHKAGTWDNYDVVMPSVTRVKDITKLTLGNASNDGWCISEVKMFLNNGASPVYWRAFSNGQWVDMNDGGPASVTFSSSSLRASSGWNYSGSQASMCYLPTKIPASELVSRVKSLAGHALGEYGNDALYWGGMGGSDYVEVSKYSTKTVQFDLDLKADVSMSVLGLDLLSDPHVDVDFNSSLSCDATNKRITLDAWLYHIGISDGGIAQPLYDLVEDEIEDLDVRKSISIDFSRAATAYGLKCPSMSIDSSANIAINWGNVSVAGYTFAVRSIPVLCL